ncbi:MAG: aminopeptidase P family protein [Chitinispirillaceae bacterium]|nr:aminopeptidase P family protein [Chitinispirillaceae bacterium]
MPLKKLARGNHRRAATTTRMAALRQLRSRESFSSILITDTIDVAYISGFSSSYTALLVSRRKTRLFTDFRYQTEALRFCGRHPEWSYEPVLSSMMEAVAACIAPGDTVGYQSDRMTVDDFKKLKKTARGARFVGCGAAVNELLLARLPMEIEAMGRAARIGDAAFRRLLADINPGVTERGLVRRLEQYCSDLGSEKPSFDTIVLFGAHSAFPHGRPGQAGLKRGQFVLVDFGCTVDGFASDMTRTVVCGKASRKQRELYRIVQNAQQKACREARAAMTARAIDALARDPIKAAGYGERFGHALGHGVGRRIHEAPRISARVSLNVPSNAVITIEPGIYLPGFGGIRIEDMAVLQQNGVRLLTHSPRELLEL